MKKIVCALLSALMLPLSTVTAVQAQEAELVDLGIPLASVFSDSSTYLYARTVWGMEAYDGKIYIGCGDYDKNAGTANGGLPIVSYDTQAKSWQTEGKLSDEQLSRFTISGDRLLIPGTDPVGGSYFGKYYALEQGEWKTYSNLPSGTHCFDLLAQGSTLFAGLGTNYGMPTSVCRSTDGGAHFKLVPFRKNGTEITTTLFTDNGTYKSTNYARTYNVFAYQGSIYATWWCAEKEIFDKFGGLYRYNEAENVFDYYGPAPYDLYRNRLSQSYDAVFKGKFVLAYNTVQVFSNDLLSTAPLSGYSGIVTCGRVIGSSFYFSTYAKTDAGYTNRLYKTDDLERCELLASFDFPCLVRSFCYDQGVFYLGTEGNMTDRPKETGTVFSLTLSPDGCAHSNRVQTTTEKGLSEHCAECWEPLTQISNPFTDIDAEQWYYVPVLKAYGQKMMSGTSASTFSPYLETTRAMLVQVLYNMEGRPALNGAVNPFSDVTKGQYYEQAVTWAYREKIVAGISADLFDPDAVITREQFAAILFRYAGYKGQDTTARADMSGYLDFEKTALYARDALCWANANRYITGHSSTVIDPKGSATRAQMASIMTRFLET